RIRDKTGTRPDSGPNLNKSVVFVFWKNDRAQIYLDTSGESISRRGYRTETSAAPMQETLAAAHHLSQQMETRTALRESDVRQPAPSLLKPPFRP
ncbi:MAG: class I SAM-dependent RNA methyltransferase, partial [Rhodohalobacter sp.]|nr:class I SAM-dependent RNA methyltransferase [Rhodohalobacter sp.]